MDVKLFLEQKPLKIILMSAASSSNTYTKTFAGIDGAGKRLADEVSLEIDANLCAQTLLFQIQFWHLGVSLESFHVVYLLAFIKAGHASC